MSKVKEEVCLANSDNKYILPKWLFYAASARDTIISPAATFNPSKAFSNNAWQSSVKPSSRLKYKTLVLTVSIFNQQHSREQWLAMIHWLEMFGFTIYLCTQNDKDEIVFLSPWDLPLTKEEDFLYTALARLTSFNEEDYELMWTQHHVERDHIAVLDSENSKELLQCLTRREIIITDHELVETSYFMAIRPKAFLSFGANPPYVERRKLLENPELLLQLSDQMLQFPNLTKTARLTSFLHNYPAQSEELIRLHGHTIDSINQLAEFIQKFPILTELLMTKALENADLWDDIPYESLSFPIQSINQVIDCLMKRMDRIQSNALIAFILEHAPQHSALLWNNKGEIIKQGRLYPQFFVVYPEKKEELFNAFVNRIYNTHDLGLLITFFPEITFALLDEFHYLFKSSIDLAICMRICPSTKKILFNRYIEKYNWPLDFVITQTVPELSANFLMKDEARITNGSMLAICILEFPHQAKRLMRDHVSVINPSGIYHCIQALTNLEDVRELIQSQIGKVEPFILLIVVSILAPRLFFWLTDILPSSSFFKNNDYFSTFIKMAPERLDWAMQHFEPTSQKNHENFYERRRSFFYSDRLDKKGLLHGHAIKKSSLPLENITYLYLSESDDLAYLTHAVEDDHLKQLAVLELVIFKNNIEELERFFMALEKHCPHLQRLILPEEMQDYTWNLPCPVTFHKTTPFSPEEEMEPNPEPAGKHQLYIANNGLDKTVTGNIRSGHYNMIQAGELLNVGNQSLPRIRTGILELSDDLSEQHYRQPVLTPMPLPRLLSPSDIKKYRLEPDTLCYCLFTIALEPGKPIRLLSIDAQEDLAGIIKPSNANKVLRFFKGDDDFFYAQTTQACDLSYLIKADSLNTQMKKRASIPSDDPVMKYIKEYQRRTDKGNKIPPLQRNNRGHWLDTLYREKGGACRHRCQAVWYTVRKNPLLRDKIRMVRIDNNHVRIELYSEQLKSWHQIDLGGTEGTMDFNKYQKTLYKPAALEKITIKKDPLPGNINALNSNPVHSAAILPAPKPLHIQGLHCSKKIKTLENLDDLRRRVLNRPAPPSLIADKDVMTQAMWVLEQARLLDIPVFYLDKPGLYGLDTPQIRLQPNGQPLISPKDDLDIFLEAIEGLPNAKILINWEAFSSHERVALDTLIDSRQKSLYGKTLPPNISIISLYATLPTDSSILSRHPKQYKSELTKPICFAPEKSLATRIIDVKGYSDWKAFLFGPIVQQKDGLVWQPGPLTKQLSRGKEKENPHAGPDLTIRIKNLPSEAINIFSDLYRQARAEGVFRYYGYTVPLPASIIIEFQQEPFTFSAFKAAICPDVTADIRPKDCILINSTLFDYLIVDKNISDKNYQSIPGLIEQHQGKRLALFITSPFSTVQWYCLFAEAEQKEVELALYLAPGIKLPEKLPTTLLEKPTAAQNSIKNRVEITAEAQRLVNQLSEKEAGIYLAVEDYSYQDLICRIDYRYDETKQCFTDFEEKESALLSALNEGKSVILYGQFSPALLEALSPLLLHTWPGTLTLVVENQLLKANDMESAYPALSFLPPYAFTYAILDEALPVQQGQIYKEAVLTIDPDQLDLTNSAAEAKAFIQQRKNLFRNAIDQQRLLQLTGETGVGKSFLIEEIKRTEAESYVVYHELAQFEDWAEDHSDKIKILVIDGKNNLHLTRFAPMITSATATLLGKDKLYTLSEKHRVVYISNAAHYGGGRHIQKLFADGSIAELQLNDIPPSFIYERQLKPLFRKYPKCPYSQFQETATRLLIDYLKQKAADALSVAVRSLQEDLLTELFAQEPIPRFFHPLGKASLCNPHFIHTPSTRGLQHAMKRFIHIHQNTPAGIGLNGFIIEGRPGIGKSESIADSLARMGYQQVTSLSHLPNRIPVYLKMDASLSLPRKKALLIGALVRGIPVWLDEGSSCMDDELEKILNAVLSGIHPDTGDPVETPGFMLFLTTNSAGLSGRSAINPALLARCAKKTMPEPLLADFETIVNKSLDANLAAIIDKETMAKNLHLEFTSNTNMTLRAMIPNLAKVALSYPLAAMVVQNKIRTALEKNNWDFISMVLTHPLYKTNPVIVTNELVLKAADTKNEAIIKLFVRHNPSIPKNIRLEAAKRMRQAGQEQLAAWLTNSCSRASYRTIWNNKPDASDFDKAKALLNDYANNRFFRIHWFRHHAAEIKKILAEVETVEELNKELSTFKLHNETGSLARRIFYIQQSLKP